MSLNRKSLQSHDNDNHICSFLRMNKFAIFSTNLRRNYELMILSTRLGGPVSDDCEERPELTRRLPVRCCPMDVYIAYQQRQP